MRRFVLGAGLLVLLLVGTYVLREATISRHSAAPPGSTTHVVVEAETNRPFSSATLEERVHALVLVCRLEVHADLVEPELEVRQPDRFAFAVTPALDTSDRRQLQGCLEDARIDHLQAGVREMWDEEVHADG